MQAITVETRYLNRATRTLAASIARWLGFIQALIAGVAVLNKFQSSLKKDKDGISIETTQIHYKYKQKYQYAFKQNQEQFFN